MSTRAADSITPRYPNLPVQHDCQDEQSPTTIPAHDDDAHLFRPSSSTLSPTSPCLPPDAHAAHATPHSSTRYTHLPAPIHTLSARLLPHPPNDSDANKYPPTTGADNSVCHPTHARPSTTSPPYHTAPRCTYCTPAPPPSPDTAPESQKSPPSAFHPQMPEQNPQQHPHLPGSTPHRRHPQPALQ